MFLETGHASRRARKATAPEEAFLVGSEPELFPRLKIGVAMLDLSPTCHSLENASAPLVGQGSREEVDEGLMHIKIGNSRSDPVHMGDGHLASDRSLRKDNRP
jgi:hypothetical protein